MVEAERLCSRIALIREGKLVACGTPDEIKTDAGQNNLEDAFLNVMEREQCSLTS